MQPCSNKNEHWAWPCYRRRQVFVQTWRGSRTAIANHQKDNLLFAGQIKRSPILCLFLPCAFSYPVLPPILYLFLPCAFSYPVPLPILYLLLSCAVSYPVPLIIPNPLFAKITSRTYKRMPRGQQAYRGICYPVIYVPINQNTWPFVPALVSPTQTLPCRR